jgi:hypothetical protein
MNRLIYPLCFAILNGALFICAARAQGIFVLPANPAPANIKVDVVAGNDDANLDPAERQMRDRLQPFLKRELSFAARVCNLDKPQRKKLAEAGQEALKKAAYQSTQAQRNVAQPRIVIFNGGRNMLPAPSNPIKMLQEALLETAKEKLPAEMSQKLADELAKRADYRKHAMIDNLVVILDKKLGLTQQQRTDIANSLAADWDDSWAPQLQIFMFDQDIIPRFPDKCISPHLQPAQKTTWDNLPNKNIQFAVDAFEVDPITGGAINDTDSDDDQ